MPHLYEITEQMRGLQRLMEDEDTPLSADVLTDSLDGLVGDLEAKAEGLLAYVANVGSDAAAIDVEIKRLQARKKALTNRQNSLREYLRYNMVAGDIKKISCPLFTVTLRKPIDVVSVGMVDQLPPEYVKTTVAPDKGKIKAALKAGLDVPFCRLIPGQPGLMIR